MSTPNEMAQLEELIHIRQTLDILVQTQAAILDALLHGNQQREAIRRKIP